MGYDLAMTTTIEPASRPLPLVRRLQNRQDMDRGTPPPAERKRLREQAGASVREVAEQLGVTYQTVWQWENRPPKRISDTHLGRYLALLAEFRALAGIDTAANSPK